MSLTEVSNFHTPPRRVETTTPVSPRAPPPVTSLHPYPTEPTGRGGQSQSGRTLGSQSRRGRGVNGRTALTKNPVDEIRVSERSSLSVTGDVRLGRDRGDPRTSGSESGTSDRAGPRRPQDFRARVGDVGSGQGRGDPGTSGTRAGDVLSGRDRRDPGTSGVRAGDVPSHCPSSPRLTERTYADKG